MEVEGAEFEEETQILGRGMLFRGRRDMMDLPKNPVENILESVAKYSSCRESGMRK